MMLTLNKFAVIIDAEQEVESGSIYMDKINVVQSYYAFDFRCFWKVFYCTIDLLFYAHNTVW